MTSTVSGHVGVPSGLLAAPEILVAPGCYDALSAALIERTGFGAAYLSGASIAYTRFGRPDIGLVSMSEVAETIAVIRERVTLPLIADGDTGFGNALNVQRTVRAFERMGASAIQLEDQQMPKRCGHLQGKSVIRWQEMAGKVRAAVDARENGMLVIARTDALAIEGLDAALDRAERYLEAGADMLFIEALRGVEDMQAALARFRGRVPLMANMVEGGKTPVMNAAELQSLGFSMVIFPGGLVRAITRAALDFLGSLHATGDTNAFRPNMLDFQQLNDLLGTAAMLERGQRYDEPG